MPYLSRLQRKAVLAKNAARKPHILACRVRELEVLLVMQQKRLDTMETRLNYQDRMLDLQEDLIDVMKKRIDLQTKRLDEKAREMDYHQRQILELGRRRIEPEEDLFGPADEVLPPMHSVSQLDPAITVYVWHVERGDAVATMQVHPSWSVRYLKQCIREEEQIDKDIRILTDNEVMCDDGRSLEDYDVMDTEVLRVQVEP